MSAITFDTLKFANRLKAAGADSRIAEAEAEALAEALEVNLKDFSSQQDIGLVRKDIEHLRKDMEQMGHDLRQEMRLLEQRMTIKLGVLMVVAVTAVAPSRCWCMASCPPWRCPPAWPA